VGLSAGAGFSGLVLLYWFIVTFFIRQGGGNEVRLLTIVISGLVVESAALLGWLKFRGRLRTLAPQSRWVLAIACWGPDVGQLVVVLAVHPVNQGGVCDTIVRVRDVGGASLSTSTRHDMPRRSIVAAALLAAGLAGCVHTEVYRVSRFKPGTATVQYAAPFSGVYKVKYAYAGGGGIRELADSERIVRKGEPLGFRVAEDGTVLAVAGADEFAVAADARALRKCVWYGRSEKPSQFAREVYKAANTTGQAAVVAGVVTGVAAGGAGLVVAEAALDEALGGGDCGDDDNDDDHHHSHHHGGGGGGGGPKPPKPGAAAAGTAAGGADKPVRPGSRNP
jgi:hypothetical protein